MYDRCYSCQVRPISIYFLQFDDTNIEHLARHGIVPEEVEQITGNEYVTARNRRDSQNRICMIGRTDGGRMLTVVLEATYDDGIWRPITGWNATSAERGILNSN